MIDVLLALDFQSKAIILGFVIIVKEIIVVDMCLYNELLLSRGVL